MKIDEELRTQLAAVVEDEGLALVATEVVGAGPKTILRLVIEGAEGVTLDQCASVSRQASALLDVADPLHHRYTLEVSSPGLDRKLYSAHDYERFAGQRVRVKMAPSYREHRVVVGQLIGLDDGVVRVRGDDTETLDLPLAQVHEARLEVDWDAILKEGKSRR